MPLAIALAALLAAADITPEPLPGTYDIQVCEGPCRPDGPVAVRGTLVLFDREPDLSSMPSADRQFLVDESLLLLHPDKKANACFVLETLDKDTSLLAGIFEVGLTRWEVKDHVLEVMLYRSPDASSIAFAVVSGDRFLGGESEEPRLRATTSYHRAFLAGRRTGSATLDPCAAAASRARSRQAS